MPLHRKRNSGAPPIVTVSGIIGSGKTSVSKELSALTGWRVVSAGTILRKMAEDRNVSVIELNEIAKTDSSIDKLIDDQLIALKSSTEPLIVDSRLAWHFIPSAFKVHIVVDTGIAANRVFSACRSDEHYRNAAEAYAANAQRQTIENERFQQYYRIDCEDWRNYNFILDSSSLLPAELAPIVLAAVEAGNPGPECAIAPNRLLPTLPMAELDASAEVEIGVAGSKMVILSGHKRVSAALESQQPLVHCRLSYFIGGDFARVDLDQTAILEWRAVHAL